MKVGVIPVIIIRAGTTVGQRREKLTNIEKIMLITGIAFIAGMVLVAALFWNETLRLERKAAGIVVEPLSGQQLCENFCNTMAQGFVKPLSMGAGACVCANAHGAEIDKHTCGGWNPDGLDRCDQMYETRIKEFTKSNSSK